MKTDKKIHFSLKAIYLYLLKIILFITLIISCVSLISSSVDLLISTDTFSSYNEFKSLNYGDTSETISESEIQSAYANYLTSEKLIQTSSNLNNFIKDLIVFILSSVFFLFLGFKNRDFSENSAVVLDSVSVNLSSDDIKSEKDL